MTVPETIQAWHHLVESGDPAGLDALLADEVTFRSPAVHAPQEGKALTTAYLTAALTVLGPTLTYQREWYSESSAVLEFTASLDGVDVHGVDMIQWDDEGRIVDFCVMARPFGGLQTLIEKMAAELP